MRRTAAQEKRRLDARARRHHKQQEHQSHVDQITFLRNANFSLEKKIRELEEKLRMRVDTSMIDSRIRLANSIGQLTEAVSKAIIYIVGKEQV